MRRLRQRGKNIGLFVPPAALLAGVGEHLPHGLPEPQRAVADREHRRPHAAAAAITQQIGPGFGGFPEAIGERDELLAAVGTDPDHHQQAQLLLVQTHLQVDPVDPQIHVVDLGQIPLGERAGLVLPLHSQPGDRRRGQPRAGAEERLERRGEVTRGQPVQVQQRQHLGHLRRFTSPRRQNRGGKSLPFTGLRVDALVVDPRSFTATAPAAVSTVRSSW